MTWSASTARESGGRRYDGSPSSSGCMARRAKVLSSRMCWSAASTASSGAATRSRGVGRTGAVECAGARLRRSRRVVGDAMVFRAPLGQVVTVARAVDVDADRGRRESIEDRRGQGRVAQVLAPFAELDIRSERGRGLLVPAIEEVEEHVRGGWFVVASAQLAKANVVNDKPFGARPSPEATLVRLIGETGVEVVDEVDAAGVADADL